MNRILAAVLAGLLLAACASDGSTDTTEETLDTTAAPDTTTAPDTTAAPDTTSPPTTAAESEFAGTITMSNISFSGTSTVQAGETIELDNQDEVPHTFTDEDGAFDVSISPGGRATYTFEEPGEYSYFCTIHPSMTGTITVEG